MKSWPQQVAHHPQGEIEVLVQQGGRRDAAGALADLLPQPGEVEEVGLELLPPLALARRAHDQPAALHRQLVQDAEQALPLGLVLDAAGDAEMAHGRQQHQVAARQGDVGADARPLVGQRVLDHLDDDLLARLQQVVDGRRALLLVRRDLLGAGVVELQVLHRLDVGGHVADVEEGVALEAHVDERGLHAGQHARHPALVDVAHEPAVTMPLDEDLRQAVVLQHGDPRLVRIALDEHLVGS